MSAAGRRLPRRLAATFLLALAPAFVSACTGASRAAETRSGAGLAAVRVAGTEAAPQQAEERLLVRRASLQLTVEDLDGTRQRAAALAAAAGGYVQHSALSAGPATLAGGQRLHLTLRVPSAALDAVLDSLARLGTVDARQVSAEDVTEQVVDLDARLTSMRAVRDRLRQHLERAANVGEVVAVERELARVQGEIDAMEARLKHLRSSAALAEITIEARRRRVLGPLGLVLYGAGWVLGKHFVLR